MHDGKNGNLSKTLFAVVLLIAALGFARHRINASGSGQLEALRQAEVAQRAAANPGTPGFSPDQPADHAAMRQQLLQELNLTAEQKTKMMAAQVSIRAKAMATGQPPFEEIRKAMDDILTPEQAEKARAFMRQRIQERLGKAQSVLPPNEFAKLEHKLQERGLPFGPRG
jgi:Spy/CpxP family protein refolding chaperone